MKPMMVLSGLFGLHKSTHTLLNILLLLVAAQVALMVAAVVAQAAT
jgi:hypothetical protein